MQHKKEILILSPFCPYSTINHAGGKIHYYYLKKLSHNYHLTIVTAALIEQIEEIKNNDIDGTYYIFYKNTVESISFFACLSKFFTQKNIFDKYAGFIEYNLFNYLYKTVLKLKKQKYNPSIIICDWTQTVLLAPKIHKLFPHTKLICVEQDVTFLKYDRFITRSKSIIKRIINTIKYKNIKKQELHALSYATEILVLNPKDKNIIIKELQISPRIITPFFYFYNKLKRTYINNSGTTMSDILFFGYMARPENYEAVIWFIENVMSKLPDIFRFVVVGASPSPLLEKYSSPRILIEGFQEDVSKYFATSLCMVCPLLFGAGIKIKILEAFSSGIPVLTNDIGIEGIPARNNKEYIH